MRARHCELTEQIVLVFYDVGNELGYGFLESVYQAAMCVALKQAGLKPETQVFIPVHFRGEVVGTFRADLVVNGLVLIALKSGEGLSRQHEPQLLHYHRSIESR